VLLDRAAVRIDAQDAIGGGHQEQRPAIGEKMKLCVSFGTANCRSTWPDAPLNHQHHIADLGIDEDSSREPGRA